MRRKSDGWINATHILKIAKFPKAKRTRILEKDVQSGIHEKVQGGYGKYQGTYVPLELGAQIAKLFGVFEILEPIFKFSYIEGTSETPPPAPKHNHASASNVARRQQSLKSHDNQQSTTSDVQRKRMKPDGGPSEDSRKRGRPKRVTLKGKEKPGLSSSQTAPITDSVGPSMGTFSFRNESINSHNSLPFLSLSRQDTEKDALQMMASNLNLRNDDLELDLSADELSRKPQTNRAPTSKEDDDELLSGKELFGNQENFGRNSFEKFVEIHKRNRLHSSSSRLMAPNGKGQSLPGLMQYHHPQIGENNHHTPTQQPNDYFTTVLEYFLYDDHSLSNCESPAKLNLPYDISNPPEPLSNIDMNQRVDNDGNSLLHWVCAMANLTLFQMLVKKFKDLIDLSSKNCHGETPLMFMVRFNNSFQQRNFPEFLRALSKSCYDVDSKGRSVLHHIASNCSITSSSANLSSDAKRSKEDYLCYYLECLMELLSHSTKHKDNDESDAHLFDLLNHQDSDGNTALHLFAYNLNRRCIKILIRYHKLLDLGLRNSVNHTIEDYLASHNFVLKIEDEISEEPTQSQVLDDGQTLSLTTSRNFDLQLHKTRLAINLQSSTANAVTEKLSEVAYAIDRELGEKDEKLLTLYKCLRKVSYLKYKSQRAVLKIFNLDYLIDDVESEYGVEGRSRQKPEGDVLVIDAARDQIIQEEISRLINDLSFQYLVVRDEFCLAQEGFRALKEASLKERLKDFAERKPPTQNSDMAQSISLAVEIQKEILKRRDLASQIYHLVGSTPLLSDSREEFKENSLRTSYNSDKDLASEENHLISSLPQQDKLYKYCKLIALSCGMSLPEVELSIDLIEQSLSRTRR